MKKIIFLLSFILLYSSCLAESIEVHQNFETMQYEISLNKEIVKTFPFSSFCGYQVIDSNIYFVSFRNSRISDYGNLCFFDCKKKELVYTKIETGCSFFVTTDLKVLTSSLCNIEDNSEISDVFNTDFSKRMPLNLSIYNLKNESLIKTYSFDKKRELQKFQIRDLYLEFIPKEGYLLVEYGVLDSSYKIYIGKLDMQTFELN
jgi:hypothetical protein